MSDLQVTSCKQMTLLGAPIGSLEVIDSTIAANIDKLTIMGETATSTSPRRFPNPSLLPGCPPTPLHPADFTVFSLNSIIKVFDGTLNRILCQVLNVDLSQDLAWLQASLPIRAGGLGVRQATQLVPSAFLASAAGCSYFVQQIMPSSAVFPDPDPSIESAISIWNQGHSESSPSPPNSFQQCTWDEPHVVATYNKLLYRPRAGQPDQSSTPGRLFSRVWSMAECFACCCTRFAYE